MTRPNMDQTLMAIATLWGERSTCSRGQVGAVIAREGRVISTGYNGAPSGMPHCVHVNNDPCTNAVHAEKNAIAFAARHGVATDRTAMYCTHTPCLPCAQLIVNAGIDRFVSMHQYRVSAGLDLLWAAGIEIVTLGASERDC